MNKKPIQLNFRPMEAKIIIEQYDNGISIKWRELERDVAPVAVVALNHDIARTIGEMVWEDIKNVMDTNFTNGAQISLEYYPKHIKSDEQERQEEV